MLFEFGDGVSVGLLPSGCEIVEGGSVDCLIVSSIRDGGFPTEPVVFVLPVKVAEGAVDSSATSRNNPVSNDPDPTNNVVTLVDVLSGGEGDDMIIGNRGADTIDGDAGNDILKGRRGSL